MSPLHQLLEQYLAASTDFEKSFCDMSPEQLLACPIEGKWTAMQVLCHLVDIEIMMASRIRAALIADKPKQIALSREEIMGMHFWENRNGEEEAAYFTALRKHTALIVRAFPGDPSDRQVILIKPDATEVTKNVKDLLESTTNHASSHLVHVKEKRAKLGLPTDYAVTGVP